MNARNKSGSEAVAAAPKPLIVACGKPTLVHSAPDRCVATPRGKESENPSIGQPFFECRKPGGFVVRAQFQTYRATTYLDIRQWSALGDQDAPTHKGATIPLARVRELGEALCRVNLPTSPEDAQKRS